MSCETGRKAISFYLDELSEGLQEVTLSFFGGEPLLKFGLIRQLVLFGIAEGQRRGKRVRFSITTNGMALKKDVMTFLREHRFSVLISWDGAPQTQDSYRCLPNQQGSSPLLERRLPQITALPDVGVRMTWTRKTLPALASNVAYFVAAGFDWMGFAPLDQMGFTQDVLDEYRRQVSLIVNLWCEELERGHMVYINPLLAMIHRVLDSRAPLHFHMHRCDPLIQRVSVSSDGTLFPCHRFLVRTEFPLGSIWDTSLDSSKVAMFEKLNAEGIDGCLALQNRRPGSAEGRHSADLIRMMEVTLEGSESMLRQGARILSTWPAETIPAQAKAILKRYEEWSGSRRSQKSKGQGS